MDARNTVIITVALMCVSPASMFASGFVHTTATLSQGRDWLSATTVGNKALFAGGYSNPVMSDVVDIYDADTDTWTAATLSVARSALAATTVGSKAIFAGGCADASAGGPSDDVDIYDAHTDTWTTATLSVAHVDLAATTVGNKALFGGGGWYSDERDVVDIFTVVLAGDLNGDGFVGQGDLDIVLASWGGSPPLDPRADTNDDGFTGQYDLDTVLNDWGLGTPAESVPEPVTLLLLSLGGLFFAGRRRQSSKEAAAVELGRRERMTLPEHAPPLRTGLASFDRFAPGGTQAKMLPVSWPAGMSEQSYGETQP